MVADLFSVMLVFYACPLCMGTELDVGEVCEKIMSCLKIMLLFLLLCAR